MLSTIFAGLNREKLFRLYPEDPFIIIGGCLSFFILRWILNRVIYRPVADFLKLNKQKEKHNKNSKYVRFVEDIWYSTFYPVSSIILFFILKDKDYFWEPSLSVKGVALLDSVHIEDLGVLRIYYLVQLGYYLQLIINLLFVDEKLADFYEMLTHHVATIYLIFFSYVGLLHRVGAYILFIHDICDIFLYWAKAAHDADYFKFANFNFAMFMIALPFVRLYFFGYHLIALFFGEDYFNESSFLMYNAAKEGFGITYGNNYACYNGYCFSAFKGCVYFLCVLWLLHLSWFFRGFSVLWKAISSGTGVEGDSRYQKEKEE
eukprot:gene6566-10729_t